MGDVDRWFDRYVVVDWSAASVPTTGPNSIWVAELDAQGSMRPPSNPSTRRAAIDELETTLLTCSGERLLVGIDVSLGFPAGTAAALGLGDPAWSSTWHEIAAVISDHSDNRNDRFEAAARLNERLVRRLGGDGPFWGCPPARASPRLATTRPLAPGLPTWRRCEEIVRDQGRRPSSVWQLMYAGSVGSQTLLAIPALVGLRERHGTRIRVWPFEPVDAQWLPRSGDVVVAEVWPTWFDPDLNTHPVRDAAQVTETARALARHDIDGSLHRWLSYDFGTDDDRVRGEEGWMLGAGTATALPN